jgi:2-polyprenyl-3-methyl-5-hydroxy-6-metoxy-1,4-benzoquinol methylase
MCSIQLSSDNPDYGWLVGKKPGSPMILKQIRDGIAYGWYSRGFKSYNVYFDELESGKSFCSEKNYLNVLSYSSPFIVMKILTEFFNSAFKSNPKDTKDYKMSFFMTRVKMDKNKIIDNLINYFTQNINIVFNEKESHFYSVEITGRECTFKQFISYIYILFVFIYYVNNDKIEYIKDIVMKTIDIVIDLDLPYFVRYMITSKFIFSNKDFLEAKNKLETIDNMKLTLCYGNTAIQRRDFIKQELSFTNSIVDIGCGNGFYAIHFSKKIEKKELTYYAIDTNIKELNVVNNKIKEKKISNIKTYLDFELFLAEYSSKEKVDVIMTEVIEHMKPKDSIALILRVINVLNFNKIIITTPNKDFNKYYPMKDEKMRHTDHVWEPTKDEFKKLIEFEVMPEIRNELLDFKFVDIGDKIEKGDGSASVTQGLIISII